MRFATRLCGALVMTMVCAAAGFAQTPVPEIAYEADANFLKLPRHISTPSIGESRSDPV